MKTKPVKTIENKTPERKRALVIKEILRHIEYDGFKPSSDLFNRLLKAIRPEDFNNYQWASGYVVKRKRKPCLKLVFLKGDKRLKTKYIEL
jgi:hypothetical protein